MDQNTTNTNNEQKKSTVISLADLARSSRENQSLEGREDTLTTVNPLANLPRKPSAVVQHQADMRKDLMDKLDKAIERTKKDLAENVIPKGREEIAKKMLEAEEKGEAPAKEDTSHKELKADDSGIPTEETVESSSINEDLDLDLSELDLDEEPEEPEDDELIIDDEDRSRKEQEEFEKINKQITDQFTQEIKAKIKPLKKTIDLTKFKVSNKPVSYSKIMAVNSAELKTSVSDWVLPNTKRSISIKEFSGSEIELLNPRNSNQNTINTFRRIYSLIYSHVVDPNKPKSLEEWLKGISIFDVKHLQFAVYKACFENSNFIPYTCSNDKCNNSVLEQYKIEDMVKFGSEEIKKDFYKLLEKESTSPTNTVEEDLVQVSDKYVIGIKIPSIYNVLFENAVLDEDFVNKFASLLGNISFISNIYIIDEATMSLVPIETKPDPNDLRKTVKNKIRIYLKIFRELNSEQYNLFLNAVRKLDADEIDIKYVRPAHKCEKCGTEIPEVEADNPLDLVFIRHQLTLVANS